MAPDYNSYEIKITTNSGNTWSTLGSVTSGIDFSMDTDMFDKYILGKWDTNEKERNDSMTILELYKKKAREEINNRYRDMVEYEYNNLDVVKEYNELVNTFNINLKQLADKYNTNDNQPLVRTGYESDYSYEINIYLHNQIEEKYKEQKDTELQTLYDFCEEVETILSISDDKDYQLEVLKNYEIIDKKGKLNI